MTTPLSKMVALLIPSPLTPKRGYCSTGRLSEAKKGVARAYGAKMHQRKTGELFVWCILHQRKPAKLLMNHIKFNQTVKNQ